MFLKLKFGDFTTTTKEQIGSDVSLATYIPLLEEAFGRSSEAVRLLGVGVKFEDPSKMDGRQMELFDRKRMSVNPI